MVLFVFSSFSSYLLSLLLLTHPGGWVSFLGLPAKVFEHTRAEKEYHLVLEGCILRDPDVIPMPGT